MRCQHNREHGIGAQCGLMQGHPGDHVSSHQIASEDRENSRPATVGDIRRIIREELARDRQMKNPDSFGPY